MARFPRPESQVIVPAQDMAAGWAANAAVYPASPVPPADLQIRMGAFIIQRHLLASGLWSNPAFAPTAYGPMTKRPSKAKSH